MKKIPLLNSTSAVLVDDRDYEFLTKWKWRLGTHGYAYRQLYVGYEAGKCLYGTVLMHRLLLMVPKPYTVDHINRNKLDNRAKNLRPATIRENSLNRTKQKNNTSGFVGVTKQSRGDTWSATTKVFGKPIFIGNFATAEKANAARIKYLELVGL